MNASGIEKRITKLEARAEPGADDGAADRLLMEVFEPYYITRLKKLGCVAIVDEIRAALRTVGPRPFGHDRPDDRPYWCAIGPVIQTHWSECGWRMKGAEFLAWGDVYAEAGYPEEAAAYNRLADEYLNHVEVSQ